MTILPLLAAVTLGCAGALAADNIGAAAPAVGGVLPADSTNRRLFDGGQRFAEFLAAAQQRKAQWEQNAARAAFPDALVARARAAGGPWKLLVIAVDGCSDSVNTIPYLARLMEQVPGVELRIIGSAAGRAIMEAHRTPDGRGATPTVLLLDADYVERGAWIERPSALQGWILAQKGVLDDAEVFTRKMRWYDEDQGRQTVEEIVALMERASRG
jgi:hypothetical protein